MCNSHIKASQSNEVSLEQCFWKCGICPLSGYVVVTKYIVEYK